MTLTRRRLGALALIGLVPALAAAQADTALDAMVRLDALYIPLLASTNAAASDARAAARASAAAARLRSAWPRLLVALAAHPPAPAQAAAWQLALQFTGRQLAKADAAIARAEWAQAHEHLEPVRETLMQVRRAAGVDYAVDRLTAFHEPMEALALAGARLEPAALDNARRRELELAFTQASALWRAVEQGRVDARVHRLSPAREAQLRRAIADTSAAMSRLSEALRGSDPALVLAAARAIKPPFARAFTAFGLAEGEILTD